MFLTAGRELSNTMNDTLYWPARWVRMQGLKHARACSPTSSKKLLIEKKQKYIDISTYIKGFSQWPICSWPNSLDCDIPHVKWQDVPHSNANITSRPTRRSSQQLKAGHSVNKFCPAVIVPQLYFLFHVVHSDVAQSQEFGWMLDKGFHVKHRQWYVANKVSRSVVFPREDCLIEYSLVFIHLR